MENLGFITVIDHPQHGLIGGYLVLNQAGRPLEFHCTNPVRPSKTQEILFGAALEPYLYGEQIARTLASKSKLKVVVILTNIVSALSASALINFPIAYISDNLTKNIENNSDSKSNSKRIISDELNESLRFFGIEENHRQTDDSKDINEIAPVPPVVGLNVEYWQSYIIGNRTIAIPAGEHEKDREILLNELNRISLNVDLLEPFTRIKLAIAETHNYK
ncbi:MAG: hypothetical protein LBB88_11895 [Planctomycetaceae bacterium]|jgi:hypothetical protein|nr:hypothetical protein [Planctomycetaceae bacterium]